MNTHIIMNIYRSTCVTMLKHAVNDTTDYRWMIRFKKYKKGNEVHEIHMYKWRISTACMCWFKHLLACSTFETSQKYYTELLQVSKFTHHNFIYIIYTHAWHHVKDWYCKGSLLRIRVDEQADIGADHMEQRNYSIHHPHLIMSPCPPSPVALNKSHFP